MIRGLLFDYPPDASQILSPVETGTLPTTIELAGAPQRKPASGHIKPPPAAWQGSVTQDVLRRHLLTAANT